MAETKYGKYFIEYDPTRWPNERRPVMARMEDSVMKGSYFYLVHWVLPGFGGPPVDYPMAGHPPHIHRDAELLFHIGTNPDDPFDLGAEVELCMGKEMEKHIITRPAVIFLPKGFIHGPWTIKRVDRPWISMKVGQGARGVGEHTLAIAEGKKGIMERRP